jgi:amino acid transporter
MVVSLAILLMAGRAIALMGIYLAGSSRLPMVAGWDHLLPAWFTRLHRRHKTPANSILFVGAVTLAFSLASLIGVGSQEAFQLIDNAATVFYGVAYLFLFAIPLVGAIEIRRNAPAWLRVAAISGLGVTLLGIFFTVFPIVDVQSRFLFAVKIIALTLIANGIGAAIFVAAERRRRTH